MPFVYLLVICSATDIRVGHKVKVMQEFMQAAGAFWSFRGGAILRGSSFFYCKEKSPGV